MAALLLPLFRLQELTLVLIEGGDVITEGRKFPFKKRDLVLQRLFFLFRCPARAIGAASPSDCRIIESTSLPPGQPRRVKAISPSPAATPTE